MKKYVDVKQMFELIYPIDSIYFSMNTLNPADLFSFGVWEKIEDVFLFGSGTKLLGVTGGKETVALTVEEMPQHKHGMIAGSNPYNKTDPEWSAATSTWGFVDAKFSKEANEGTHRYLEAINYEGNSAAHENMPPYLAVNIWRRVA